MSSMKEKLVGLRIDFPKRQLVIVFVQKTFALPRLRSFQIILGRRRGGSGRRKTAAVWGGAARPETVARSICSPNYFRCEVIVGRGREWEGREQQPRKERRHERRQACAGVGRKGGNTLSRVWAVKIPKWIDAHAPWTLIDIVVPLGWHAVWVLFVFSTLIYTMPLDWYVVWMKKKLRWIDEHTWLALIDFLHFGWFLCLDTCNQTLIGTTTHGWHDAWMMKKLKICFLGQQKVARQAFLGVFCLARCRSLAHSKSAIVLFFASFFKEYFPLFQYIHSKIDFALIAECYRLPRRTKLGCLEVFAYSFRYFAL